MADTNNTTPTTAKMGKELGSSGVFVYSGNIVGQEYNPKLTGQNAIKQYDIMRRSDPTVRATLQVCKLPLLSTQWDIEPATDPEGNISKEDQENADFIKRELMQRNVNFHDFLREGLSFFDFGYSIAEKTLELTDFNGQLRIGIQKLGYRKQTSLLAWEMKNGQPGIQQQLIGSVVDIPMPKLIIFTHDKEGDNYEGVSLLRYAYKSWDMKDKLERINVIALEKMAIGVPVLKKPDDADAGELTRARRALREFRGNEEGYQEIPTGWEIEMLDMKANSTKDVIPTIQYLTREISKSVLAQFIELGGSEGASGSRAVSQDHSKLFIASEEAVAKNIQSTLQEQLIKQLCDLNFSNLPNGYPKLTFNKIGDDDVVVMADAISKFVTAGTLSPDPDVEKHIRETLHLPAMPTEVSDLWKDKFEAAKTARTNISKGLNPDGSDPTAPVDPEKDKTLPDEKKPADPEKNKKDLKASVLADAQKVEKKFFDIIRAE